MEVPPPMPDVRRVAPLFVRSQSCSSRRHPRPAALRTRGSIRGVGRTGPKSEEGVAPEAAWERCACRADRPRLSAGVLERTPAAGGTRLRRCARLGSRSASTAMCHGALRSSVPPRHPQAGRGLRGRRGGRQHRLLHERCRRRARRLRGGPTAAPGAGVRSPRAVESGSWCDRRAPMPSFMGSASSAWATEPLTDRPRLASDRTARGARMAHEPRPRRSVATLVDAPLRPRNDIPIGVLLPSQGSASLQTSSPAYDEV